MELRVEYDDLQNEGFDSGGGEILFYLGLPFTGTIVEYNNNAVLIYEEEFKNGHRDGVRRTYFANGQKEREYFQRFNKLYGMQREWDTSGNLVYQHNWDAEP